MESEKKVSGQPFKELGHIPPVWKLEEFLEISKAVKGQFFKEGLLDK